MRVRDMISWEAREKLATKMSGERKYIVRGKLCFWLKAGSKAYPAALKAMIQRVDRDFPWRDDVHPVWHRDFKSIDDLSGGEVTTDNISGAPTKVWFTIKPYCNIRKPQIHAYEKYMETLAKNLAKIKFEGLESVGHGVVTSSMSLVYVPE